jgi:GTP-binding protein
MTRCSRSSKARPAPEVDPEGPFQMQISQLDYNELCRHHRHRPHPARPRVKTNMPVAIVDREGKKRQGRILQVLGFLGLERIECRKRMPATSSPSPASRNSRSPTPCARRTCAVEALPALTVDEPTISMTFQVNNSPFAGKDGKFLTSRQIRDRLKRELLHNVALRVEDTEDADKFRVSGRGELHLSILIENMRREGYELAVSRPEVIVKEVDGQKHGALRAAHRRRGGAAPGRRDGAPRHASGRDQATWSRMARAAYALDFMIPSRGLIGFQTEFLTLTQGTGLMFQRVRPLRPDGQGQHRQAPERRDDRQRTGKAPAYALFNLQERGRLFDRPKAKRSTKARWSASTPRTTTWWSTRCAAKQLTNIRAAGKDDNLMLTPPIRSRWSRRWSSSTTTNWSRSRRTPIRLRKKQLTENDRKQAARKAG